MNIIPKPNTSSYIGESEFVHFNCVSINNESDETYDDVLSQLMEDLNAVYGMDQNSQSINLKIQKDRSLQSDHYLLQITSENIEIKVCDRISLLNACATLLQMIEKDEGQILRSEQSAQSKRSEVYKLPCVSIEDYPHASYRGLMIDVARKPHTIETLKKMVLMCFFYKINYLHIHFTDKQSYTLPSRVFPKLPSKNRHFTFGEINELVQLAETRGVTLIPEIDMPGHSRSMIHAMPEVFAVNTKRSYGRVLNAGKEEVYEAIDKLVEELCELFPNSPYIHLGADEAGYDGAEDDPDITQYIAEHDIPNMRELYRHFITRIYEIVKKYGRKLCIWEGFRPEGMTKIPTDIPVYVFECYFNPKKLADMGYTLVNTSWQPIYAVPRKSWPVEDIYKWNMYRWENWATHSAAFENPFQLSPDDPVIGAQMCSWEQKEKDQVTEIRRRIAGLSENVWNREKALQQHRTIKEEQIKGFIHRLSKLDIKLGKLFDYYYPKPNFIERLKLTIIRLFY